MRMLLALFALVALTGAKPVDWTRTVTTAPSGAYVLGNPNAKVRLVEYLSYTCPHCAHFTKESSAPLRQTYVAKGQVAVELRNAVRDRLDLTASLLSRCGGPSRVFGNSEAIFAAQDSLIAKVTAFEGSGAKLPDNLNASLFVYANASGLTALMATRGVNAAQTRACLNDPASRKQVLATTKEAWNVRKIPGTPAFLINGTFAGGGWGEIEPLIRTALGLK